jgi:hypothetical protein
MLADGTLTAISLRWFRPLRLLRDVEISGVEFS